MKRKEANHRVCSRLPIGMTKSTARARKSEGMKRVRERVKLKQEGFAKKGRRQAETEADKTRSRG